MKRLRIVNIDNASFPVNVFIADTNANNKVSVGTINPGPVPPTAIFTTSIPDIFQTADEVMLIIEDNNNCQTFKILDCLYCIYQIVITKL